MTNQEPTPRSRRTLLTLILVGALVLALGVVAGVIVSRGGFTATPATTTTVPAGTLAPAPTTTLPATTTTSAPPTTTTIVPENQQEFGVLEDTTVDFDEDEPLGLLESVELDHDSDDDVKRGLLRFELTDIPEGEEIVSAQLRLIQLSGTDLGGSVSLVGGPWSESETTWESAPPVGDVIAPLPIDSDDGPIEIDVTPAVTGNGVVDFYLTTPFSDGVRYASKESGQGAVLVVSWGTGGESADNAYLVGAGDIASCDSEGDEITAELIGQVAADADEMVVFTVGDNAYESGTLQEFNDCYEPTWGQFKGVTRPAAGAREYRTAGAAGHFAYFGSAAGDSSEGYYSYQLNGWHLVVLNSNCDEIGGCDEGSPQETWLREDLSASSASCTLAYWHHPLFSSSSGGGEEAVLPLFEALYETDAELVINADVHFYERFEPQSPDGEVDPDGLRQFTVGTGGRSIETAGARAANSAVQFDGGFGVLALNLFPGGYRWEFISEPGASFTDSGAGDCR